MFEFLASTKTKHKGCKENIFLNGSIYTIDYPQYSTPDVSNNILG